MTLALDLAQQGIRVVLLDDDDKLSAGSRAICFAKRTLEIFDRLGVGDAMVAKGVSWNVGKVFSKDDHVYTFNLLAEDGHHRPAFINLQQYYVEGVDMIVFGKHLADVPRYAFSDHRVAHTEAIKNFERAFSEADGA